MVLVVEMRKQFAALRKGQKPGGVVTKSRKPREAQEKQKEESQSPLIHLLLLLLLHVRQNVPFTKSVTMDK